MKHGHAKGLLRCAGCHQTMPEPSGERYGSIFCLACETRMLDEVYPNLDKDGADDLFARIARNNPKLPWQK